MWSTDEVHFQQHGSRCRMWVPPEIKDPVLLHHPTRDSVGYFGAVRLRDGKFVFQREDEVFNSETFFPFLKKLRKASCHSGRRVIVLMDNAKYHHGTIHEDWRNRAKPEFTVEFLPSYSPELNPIERVWKLTRRKATHNQYFPTLPAIAERVEEVFEPWQTDNATLRRLCAVI